MLFSVIIPTCNRNDLLSKCLDQLHYDVQGLSKTDYEVIVTDDSKENIAKNFINVNFPWVQWVEGPKRGPAANRNSAAKKVNGDWLIFIDDDCEPSTSLLAEYKKAHIRNDHKYFVFEGLIQCNDTFNSPFDHAPVNLGGGKLWSCNFMIKKDIFWEMNGFDENFPYPHLEDVDFRRRLECRGYFFPFINEAYVIHPKRPFGSFKKIARVHECEIYFYRKWGEEKNLFSLAWLIFKVRVVKLIRTRFSIDSIIFFFSLVYELGYLFLFYSFWKKKYQNVPKIHR